MNEIILCATWIAIYCAMPVEEPVYEYGFSVDDKIPNGFDTFEEQWETPYPFEIPKTPQVKKSSSGSSVKKLVVVDSTGDMYEVELEEEITFKDKMKDKKKKGKKPKK